MSERHVSITCLVFPRLTQVHDDLGGSRVQGVEIRSVILVKTLGGEVVNASESVHKFPDTRRTIRITYDWLLMDFIGHKFYLIPNVSGYHWCNICMHVVTYVTCVTDLCKKCNI